MLEKFTKSGLSFKFWNLLALSVIGKLDLHTTTNTMTDKVVTIGYSGDMPISVVFITCSSEDEAKNLARFVFYFINFKDAKGKCISAVVI